MSARAALDSAAKAAQQITDPHQREELLEDVARTYARNDDFDSAIAIIRTDSALMWQASDDLAHLMLRCNQIDQLKTVAPTLDGRSKSLTLEWLAEWQAKHDDPTASQETLASISDRDIRGDAEAHIALARALTQDPKMAEASLRQFAASASASTLSADDLVSRDMALIDVMKNDLPSAAAELKKLSDRDKVYWMYVVSQGVAEEKVASGTNAFAAQELSMALQFLHDDAQTYPLSLLAGSMAQSGGYDSALRLANALPDAQRREEALVIIAVHLITAGKSERAKEVIEQLPPVPKDNQDLEATREGGLARIAIAQANAGSGADALKTLQAIRDPRLDPMAKWQRSYALAVSGNFGEATATACQIPLQNRPIEVRWQAIRLVASVIAHDKGAADASVWANKLPDPRDRLSAFVGTAEGLLGPPIEEVPPYYQD